MNHVTPVFLLVDDDLDDTFLFEEMLQEVVWITLPSPIYEQERASGVS